MASLQKALSQQIHSQKWRLANKRLILPRYFIRIACDTKYHQSHSLGLVRCFLAGSQLCGCHLGALSCYFCQVKPAREIQYYS